MIFKKRKKETRDKSEIRDTSWSIWVPIPSSSGTGSTGSSIASTPRNPPSLVPFFLRFRLDLGLGFLFICWWFGISWNCLDKTWRWWFKENAKELGGGKWKLKGGRMNFQMWHVYGTHWPTWAATVMGNSKGEQLFPREPNFRRKPHPLFLKKRRFFLVNASKILKIIFLYQQVSFSSS